jgi:hypothetical protein
LSHISATPTYKIENILPGMIRRSVGEIFRECIR